MRITDVPTDALGLVLSKLTLVHEIAAVAPTCRALKLAVLIALKARPFSRKAIKLRGSLSGVAVVRRRQRRVSAGAQHRL